MSIFEKLFGSLQGVFSFLNRKDSPSNKASLKESSGNVVQQAGRDFNIGVGHSEDVSDLERRILRKLYKEYRATGKLFRWKVTDAYTELGIEDGSYVGPLNDSMYINLEGEDLVLTNDGIRYMDSRFSKSRPQLDLERGFIVSGGSQGNFISFHIKNIGSTSAVDVRWRLESEGAQTSLLDLGHSIDPGGLSKEMSFSYTETDFFRRQLKSPRIVFFYKDTEGNEFVSGRAIRQGSRADGNFNIHSRPGDYFQG